MMRYLLVVLFVGALWAPVAHAHDDAATAAAIAQYRLLQAENKLLKAQIAVLKKKLGLGPVTKPTTKPATTQPTTQSSTQPSTQPAKGGPIKTFAIHNDAKAWWADPAALTFEVRLREVLAATIPAEAPAPWLIRNKFHAGKEPLKWDVRIMSARGMTQTEAGRLYYSARDVAERLQKRIKEAEDSLDTITDPVMKAEEAKGLAEYRVRLATAEAEKKRWNRALGFKEKGSTILEAIYRENRRGRLVPVLYLTLVLPADERDKLTKYEAAKRAKMPRGRRTYCPVRVTGKVDAVVYDGSLIRVDVDGKWGDAPLDVPAAPKKTVKPGSGKTVRPVGARVDR